MRILLLLDGRLFEPPPSKNGARRRTAAKKLIGSGDKISDRMIRYLSWPPMSTSMTRSFTREHDGPRLIGSRCAACGTFAFPAQDGCARCMATGDGRPSSSRHAGRCGPGPSRDSRRRHRRTPGKPIPSAFEPFGVGYVELPGEVKVEARLTESEPSRLEIGMAMELVGVPLADRRRWQPGADVRISPRDRRRERAMTDVAIVGIGMHQFGRTDGVSGMEQGVVAVRRALADAGVQWDDMQFAVGGSASAGAADTIVSKLGLTGLQFTNVSNGCATGGTALFTAAYRHPSRDLRRRHRGRVRQARAGRLPREHPVGRSRRLVRRQRPGPHHAVLRDEDQPLHARARHHARARLAKVAAKAFRNGAQNPMAWRRKPVSEEEILDADMLSLSADEVHVLLARRGRGRPGALPGRSSPAASPTAPCTSGRRGPLSTVRELRGAGAVARARARRRVRPSMLLVPRSRPRASVPRTSTSRSSRTPKPAPRSCTWRRTGSAPTVSRSS